MSLDIYLDNELGETLFEANITHNLGEMAHEAGLYLCCWRPDENGIEKAAQLIDPLTAGILLLRSDRARFERFNPRNGWGDYDGLLRFCENLLRECVLYPNLLVKVSR